MNHLERMVHKFTKKYGAQTGAMIVHRNKIIAIASNSYKSDPFQARFSKHIEAIYLHAELNAMKQGIKYLNSQYDYEKVTKEELQKCTMYVLRLRHISQEKKARALAKPCAACHAALAGYGFKTVIYSDYDNRMGML